MEMVFKSGFVPTELIWNVVFLVGGGFFCVSTVGGCEGGGGGG